jgi:hypothetical protein
VQSSRPILILPIRRQFLNINDKDFNFKYIEFGSFKLQSKFDFNLMSVLALQYIIGLDAETFHRMVEQHLWKPRKNTNLAQSGFKGINLMEGTKIVIF